MNIWDVLKIEQTKDKDALKKAYRMRLSSVNPEDDPEGFMELRKAYEEAVRLADIPEECKEAKNKAPVSEEEQTLLAIYDTFSNRINPDVWLQLFDTDYYVSLDTCEEALSGLLRFLLKHIFLPQKVWRVIVEWFDIAGNKRELSEAFPENFLDYILNNARYDDIINYDTFILAGNETAEEIDAYIRDYIDLDRMIRAHNPQAAKKQLEKLTTAYSFSNSYLTLCRLRIKLQNLHDAFEAQIANMTEEEKKLADLDTRYAEQYADAFKEIIRDAIALASQYPADITLQIFCGDVAMVMQDYAKAKEFYDAAKNLDADNYFVRVKQAEIAFRVGEYKSSRDQFMELLKENHYDDNVRVGMVRANQKMIENNLKHLKSNPDDMQAKLEIGWSYYQSYQFQDAIDFLKNVEPDQARKFEYYNVLGRCYLGVMDYENAKECFFTWADLIESLPKDDVSEDAEKKRKRYPYVNFLISDCYLKEKNYKQALHYLNQSLSVNHEEIILSYEAACELQFCLGNYTECLKACEFLIEKDDQDYIGYLYKAKACRELKYIQEAYNACERAIHLYPYLAVPYAVEIQLFMDANQYNQAEDTIKRYEIYENQSDSIDFCKAKLAMIHGNTKKAIKILASVATHSDSKTTDLDEYTDVFLMLGVCYSKEGAYRKALQQFTKVHKLDSGHPMIHLLIGSMYLKLGELDHARKYLDIQIKQSPTAKAYSERGTAHFLMRDYIHALEDCRMALSLEPENIYTILLIGRVKEALKKYKAAADAYQKVYSLAENNNDLRKDCMQFLARVYQCMNWFTESRKLYEDYRIRYEWDADIAYDYANLLVRIGKVKQAIESLRPYIDDSACVRKLIEIYGDAGYIDLAHETFEYAVSKTPQDYRIYGVMGDVFRRYELYDAAKNVYEQAIKLDTKKEANYYSEWLECLVKVKPLRSIKKYLPDKTDEKESVDSPVSCIKQARLLRLKKEYPEALALLQQGQTLPRCSGCFYSICHRILYEKAVLYEKKKNYAMARSMYEEAIKICGQHTFYETCLNKIKDKK